MFDQLARTYAIFFFVVNGQTWIDGGHSRSGPTGGRNNVVYHPESRGELGARFEGDQGRFGIGQDQEHLAGNRSRNLFELAHLAGTENFQVADEGDRRRSAAPGFFG
jgi:hypothetical protein